MAQQTSHPANLPTYPNAAKANNQGQTFPSAFNLFKPSINLLLFNIKPLLIAALTPAAIFLLALLVLLPVAGSETASFAALVPSLFLILLAVVAVFISLPVVTVTLLAALHGEHITIQDALPRGLKFFWRYLALSIATTTIILVGFVLLIVPGFFMIKRYLLSSFYLVDRDLGVFEAMKQSAADAKRFPGAIWGLIGVIVLIQLTNLVPILGEVASTVLAALYTGAFVVRYGQIQIVRAKEDHVAPTAAARSVAAPTSAAPAA